MPGGQKSETIENTLRDNPYAVVIGFNLREKVVTRKLIKKEVKSWMLELS